MAVEPKNSINRTQTPGSQAFGRFGMRIFTPMLMPHAHWHGHVEANFLRSGYMNYLMDGSEIIIPPRQLVIFWAGTPHRLREVIAEPGLEPKLCNIYLPLDEFLLMPHIARLQAELLSGAIVSIPEETCNWDGLLRWYRDYRDRKAEQLDLVKMEMNAVFRRASIRPFTYLRNPAGAGSATGGMASIHVRHVVTMVRHVLESLDKPLANADVAKPTGLNVNYALGLFSQTMHLSLKKFVIRMRLLRARSLLVETDMAIANVALECGFGSVTQFYHHFANAYGTTPHQTRTFGLPARKAG